MATLRNEAEKVKNEWRRLERQWKKTSEEWNDGVKRQFEKEFWQEFDRQVPGFIKTLEETSQAIAGACREFKISS